MLPEDGYLVLVLRFEEVSQPEDARKYSGGDDLLAKCVSPGLSFVSSLTEQSLYAVDGAVGDFALDGKEASIEEANRNVALCTVQGRFTAERPAEEFIEGCEDSWCWALSKATRLDSGEDRIPLAAASSRAARGALPLRCPEPRGPRDRQAALLFAGLPAFCQPWHSVGIEQSAKHAGGRASGFSSRMDALADAVAVNESRSSALTGGAARNRAASISPG